MSKVLVIPDIHLKPRLFDRATAILESGQAELTVVLGDLVDDWGKGEKIDLYQETLNRAILFAQKFPQTRWCWGNHDISYILGLNQSGYSYQAAPTVIDGIKRLQKAVKSSLRIVHYIDNVLFSHAGVTDIFAQRFARYDDTLEAINSRYTPDLLWLSSSPLWARPQEDYNSETGQLISDRFHTQMWRSDEFLQVVGHTPTRKVMQFEKLVSTDVFSTYPDGRHIGECKFIIVNTKSQSWEYANEL